jgi:hypothetical protein
LHPVSNFGKPCLFNPCDFDHIGGQVQFDGCAAGIHDNVAGTDEASFLEYVELVVEDIMAAMCLRLSC